MSSHVHPTQDDPVVGALSEVVGGPVGQHAGRARWGTPLAVLLAVTALVFALGMVSKGECASKAFVGGNTQFTHLCYSDVPYAYVDNGFVEQVWPWSDDDEQRARFQTMAQPALVGLWSWAAARVTYVLSGSPDLGPRYAQQVSDLGADDDVRTERILFVAVNAVGFGVLAMLGTIALSRAQRRRPWDAAAWAAAPLLASTGLVSWDVIGAVCAAGALWAWSRQRVVLAGVLVGLGVSAGVWPVLLLAAFLLTSLRREPDERGHPVLVEVVPTALSALLAWVVVNAPAFFSSREQWDVWWHYSWHRKPDAGTFWTVISETGGITDGTARFWSWALVGVCWIGVVVLALRAPLAPRVSQVAVLLVAPMLLLGVDYRPQQVLWLLPLAALAAPRWRDQLVWQGCELVYFAMVWWWLGSVLEPGGGGNSGFYWIGIGVHVVGTGYLVVSVVLDVVRPWRDPANQERQDTMMRSNVVAV